MALDKQLQEHTQSLHLSSQIVDSNLQSAFKKCERYSATECGGYINQIEMLELIKLGARMAYDKKQHEKIVTTLQNQRDSGNIFSLWRYFLTPKELADRINNTGV